VACVRAGRADGSSTRLPVGGRQQGGSEAPAAAAAAAAAGSIGRLQRLQVRRVRVALRARV
jgi:hypothetical protein